MNARRRGVANGKRRVFKEQNFGVRAVSTRGAGARGRASRCVRLGVGVFFGVVEGVGFC